MQEKITWFTARKKLIRLLFISIRKNLKYSAYLDGQKLRAHFRFICKSNVSLQISKVLKFSKNYMQKHAESFH